MPLVRSVGGKPASLAGGYDPSSRVLSAEDTTWACSAWQACLASLLHVGSDASAIPIHMLQVPWLTPAQSI